MSKQLEVLSNPNLLETLTLLADEDMKEGLKKLKQIGRFGIESVDKTKVTETPNASASAASVLQSTVSNTNNMTAPEPLSIKIESEQQGDYMSEEAFEHLSSPKKGKKWVGDTGTPKTTPTAKHVKLITPPDDYMLMAEMK